MIAKGNRHGNGQKLASYLITGADGERAQLHELRGFASDDIFEAFQDVHVMAEATKAEKPLFHVQVRNREGEKLSREQWVQAADRIERILGLTGQPRAIAFHIEERNGDEHMHIAFSLVDADTLKLRPLPFFKFRLKTISRELEREFGLEPVTNERRSPIKYAATRAEEQQAQRLGLDKEEVRNAIRACWDRTCGGADFQDELEHEHMVLTLGDRRNLVVVDHLGGLHALGKRILDVNKSAILERLPDIDLNALPHVEEVRQFLREAQAEKHPDRLSQLKEELADVDRELYGPALDKLKRETADAAKALAQDTPQLETRGPSLEELDYQIFHALLHQAVRSPERLEDVQILAWRMPDNFAIELSEAAAQIAATRYLEPGDIRKLITERDLQAHIYEAAEFDERLRLLHPQLPALPVIEARTRKDAAAARISALDPTIYSGLIGHLIRDPEQLGDLPVLLPEELMADFDAAMQAQQNARALELADIGKLIAERNREALRQLDAESSKLIHAQLEREYAQRDPAREEIEWQDAIAKAAIEKEKTERRFVEGKEPRETRAGAAQPGPAKPAAPELRGTAGEIQLAYALAHTGQEFANALEDRGLILARVTEADAERLNRWERKRLKEVTDLEAALTEAGISAPEAEGQEPGKARKQAAADMWFSQTGGVEKLTPGMREKADAAYARWEHKSRYDFADYVKYVQEHAARRAAQQAQTPEPPHEKYKTGELVVVDRWANVHQLSFRNTGDTRKEREEHLKDIDLAALLSVSAAESAMSRFGTHRQDEWQHAREQKRREKHRAHGEEYWPVSPVPPQPTDIPPSRQFEDAGRIVTGPPPSPSMPANFKGAAAHIWTAYHHSDNARAFAAALKEQDILLAAVTKDEAELSHRKGAFAREVGNYAPQYREGEIIAVAPGYYRDGAMAEPRIYRVDPRTTGEDRPSIEKFLAPLDRGPLQGIEATKDAVRDLMQLRLNEKLWPTLPPQPAPIKTPPDRHFGDTGREAAQPEPAPEMPANLKGRAADIWAAYNIRIHMQERERKNELTGESEKYHVPIALKGGRDPYRFAAALEEKGMALARATKEEAESSQNDAGYWKQRGEWRPAYREGEFVAVTQHGAVYSLNRRTTGRDAAEVQRFLSTAEWKGLAGIEGAKQAMQARVELRAIERHAKRDEIAAARLDRATNIWKHAPARGRNKQPVIRPAAAIGDAAIKAVKPFGILGNLFEGLIAPKLTPKQKLEGEIARHEREDTAAEKKHDLEFSQHLAALREREQHRQAGREQRARDRERDRDR